MNEPSNTPENMLSQTPETSSANPHADLSDLPVEERDLILKLRRLPPGPREAVANVVAVMADDIIGDAVADEKTCADSAQVVHVCDGAGLGKSILDELVYGSDRVVSDMLTDAAVVQVLHGLQEFTYEVSKKVDSLCREHLSGSVKREYEVWWGPLDDAQGTLLHLTAGVAAVVNRNLPTVEGSLEDMLADALKRSGFCCPGAVDAYVAKSAVGMIAFCQRQLPGFDPDWFTLAGVESRTKIAAGGDASGG